MVCVLQHTAQKLTWAHPCLDAEPQAAAELRKVPCVKPPGLPLRTCNICQRSSAHCAAPGRHQLGLAGKAQGHDSELIYSCVPDGEHPRDRQHACISMASPRTSCCDATHCRGALVWACEHHLKPGHNSGCPGRAKARTVAQMLAMRLRRCALRPAASKPCASMLSAPSITLHSRLSVVLPANAKDAKDALAQACTQAVAGEALLNLAGHCWGLPV